MDIQISQYLLYIWYGICTEREREIMVAKSSIEVEARAPSPNMFYIHHGRAS